MEDQPTREIAARKAARGPRRPPGADQTAAFPTLPLLVREPWPGRTGARRIILVNIFFAAIYVGWWIAVTPSPGGAIGLFIALAAAEAYTMFNLTGLWHAMWNAGFEAPRPGEQSFTVDVYIPTLGEPLDVLRRTIAAAVAIHEPHETYVLDDGCRDEVRNLAQELGASYLAREESTGAKAGNLNNALRRTDGELIVVFDADHVARRDFLRHLLSYFDDPSVGVVQTPQFYGNARENDVARGAWEQQVVFYGPILRGKHGNRSAFMAGTNAIVRRAALEDVGGFSEESVVEDFVTSMKMQRRGWYTAYFPYILAEGEGPRSLRAYFSQQLRWARGAVAALFGEPLRRGLSSGQRYQNLVASSFYFYGFAVLIYILLPVFALLFRQAPFGPEGATFLLVYVPYMATSLYNVHRELGGRFGPRNVQFAFGSFPIYIAAVLSVLIGIKAKFTATGAEEGDRPPALGWVTVAAFVLLAGSVIAAPFIHPMDTWTVVSMAWAVVNLMLLWWMTKLMVLEAIGRRREGEERFVTEPVDPDTAPGAPTRVLGLFAKPPLPEMALPSHRELHQRTHPPDPMSMR